MLSNPHHWDDTAAKQKVVKSYSSSLAKQRKESPTSMVNIKEGQNE